MNVTKTEIPGLLILEPRVFGDTRGFFFEGYSKRTFDQLAGTSVDFVQDNQARSVRGVLRGLHYQIGEYAQAKLVSVIEGEVLDVVVDLREDSPTYGRQFSLLLSGENKKQLFVPRGFAHGYAVLSPTSLFFYKCDNYYAPKQEGGLKYDDPTLNIDWILTLDEIALSEKDKKNPLFNQHLPSGIKFTK